MPLLPEPREALWLLLVSTRVERGVLKIPDPVDEAMYALIVARALAGVECRSG